MRTSLLFSSAGLGREQGNRSAADPGRAAPAADDAHAAIVQ